jgi:hypothetical protein
MHLRIYTVIYSTYVKSVLFRQVFYLFFFLTLSYLHITLGQLSLIWIYYLLFKAYADIKNIKLESF